MSSAARTDVYIRWAVRRDLDAILAIDAARSAEPLTEDRFRQLMLDTNTIGMVAELPCGRPLAYQVAGYMIYATSRRSIDLLGLAVAAEFRRQGIGTAMLDRLKSKLSPHRRTEITVAIADGNLPAQLFLKAQGFRADRVLHGFGDDDSDAYLFYFALAEEEDPFPRNDARM